jgi:hypothetical protein
VAGQLVTADVKGIPEFQRGCATLTDNIGETAGMRLGLVADQAAGDTRVKVPYLTGKLAGSIRSKLAKSERKATVRMGGRVPYAGWIEFGGTRGRAYVKQGRYLFPTAQAAGPRALRESERAANDEIRSMRWPRP